MRFITTGDWMSFLIRLRADRRAVAIAQTLYYALITSALIVLYGQGDFSPPPFVYQGF